MCVECGASFTARTEGHRFCSARCRVYGNRRQKAPAVAVERRVYERPAWHAVVYGGVKRP